MSFWRTLGAECWWPVSAAPGHRHGAVPAWAGDAADRLSFGSPRAAGAADAGTPAEKLIPQLVDRMNKGTDLRTLVAAGAWPTPAISPARTTSASTRSWPWRRHTRCRASCPRRRPLPVLKVLYRNTAQMQAQGGCEHEKLHPIEASEPPDGSACGAADGADP